MPRTTVSRAIVRAYHAAVEEHAAAVRIAHDITARGGHCRTETDAARYVARTANAVATLRDRLQPRRTAR